MSLRRERQSKAAARRTGDPSEKHRRQQNIKLFLLAGERNEEKGTCNERKSGKKLGDGRSNHKKNKKGDAWEIRLTRTSGSFRWSFRRARKKSRDGSMHEGKWQATTIKRASKEELT